MFNLFKRYKVSLPLIFILLFLLVEIISSVNSGGTYEINIKDINASANYARQSIINLANKGIINGDQNGNFNPLNAISRAEMVKLIVSVLELDTTDVPDKPSFKDVPKEQWAYRYVEAAYREGIVAGIEEGVFGVNAKSTREQMAALFVRSLGLTEGILEGRQVNSNISRLKDYSSISSWARNSVEFSMASGLMQGIGNNMFGAGQYAQRQQAAVLIERFITNMSKVRDMAEGILSKIQHVELYKALEENTLRYTGSVKSNFTITSRDNISGFTEEYNMYAEGKAKSDNFDINYVTDTVSGGTGLPQTKARIVVLDGKYYTKYEGIDRWKTTTKAEYQKYGLRLQVQGFREFLKHYDDSEIIKTGTETLNGVSVDKYKIVMKDDKLKQLVKNLVPDDSTYEYIQNILQNGYDARMEFYLDNKGRVTHQFLSLSSRITSVEENIDFEVRCTFSTGYSNIGESVVISAPAIS